MKTQCFQYLQHLQALRKLIEEIAALVLAIAPNGAEQWNVRRHMSQELCSVATNDAELLRTTETLKLAGF